MAQFGLDKPLWQQYFIYLGNLLQGELGQSFRYREPVAERILTLLPNTLILTFFARSSPLCVRHPGRRLSCLAAAAAAVEKAAIPLVLMTRAMPEFWLGMVLLAVFSFWLGWFPAGGTRPAGADYRQPFGALHVARLPELPGAAGADAAPSTARACRCC